MILKLIKLKNKTKFYWKVFTIFLRSDKIINDKNHFKVQKIIYINKENWYTNEKNKKLKYIGGKKKWMD